MPRTAAAACVAAVLAVVTAAAAQQPAGGPARNDGVTTPNDYEQTHTPTTGAQPMTLVGCLDRATNGTYELRNARVGQTGSAGTAGTTGTTAGAAGTTSSSGAQRRAPSGTSSTWILKSTTDLAPHVGHQVEITGRPASAETGGGNTATTSPPTTTSTGARVKDAGDNARSLDVNAVRMLSRSCS